MQPKIGRLFSIRPEARFHLAGYDPLFFSRSGGPVSRTPGGKQVSNYPDLDAALWHSVMSTAIKENPIPFVLLILNVRVNLRSRPSETNHIPETHYELLVRRVRLRVCPDDY